MEEHVRRRAWWTRWWAIGRPVLIAGGVTAVAVSVTASGKGSPSQEAGGRVQGPGGDRPGPGPASRPGPAGWRRSRVSPPSGTTGVALDAAVTVSTTAGTLTSVQVADAAGRPLPGALAPVPAGVAIRRCPPAGRPTGSWPPSAPDGVTAQRASTFTTWSRRPW